MLEEEEEQEPLFTEDPRVELLGEKVCLMLRLKSDSWTRFALEEQNQALLLDFFQNRVRVLLMTPSPVLTASTEVSSQCSCERLYILKKDDVPILSENFQNILLFGLLSPCVLTQLTNSMDKVCLPLLTNKSNRVTWPSATSQDVARHVERLSSEVAVVTGRIRGRTVLPVAAASERIHSWPAETASLQDCYDGRSVMNSIESMVINWTHLIQKVLKEDSSEPTSKERNPGPSSELHFWRSRTENIQNIYAQLQSAPIQKIMRILEVADSSYYPSFKALTEEVSHALQKARDVDLHLQQLQPLLLHVTEAEFSSLYPSIPPLIHLIFLVWSHCGWYRSPARVVVLLQEVGNLFIQQASSYLCAEELLQADAEEAREKLQTVVKIFRGFKENFHTCRERVRAGVGAGRRLDHWDFPAALVLTRFDRFLGRVLLLEDMFSVMLELQKLQKLVFGGLKGRTYTEQVSLLLSEFQQLCKSLTGRQYDPLDLDSQDFEEDYTHFKDEVTDCDRRLANILCLAYKDCSGLESVLKLLAVFRPFLERDVIKKTFILNLPKLIQMFGDELESCKLLFNSQIHQWKKSKAVLCKNMSPVSGALKWAGMLRERIRTQWESLQPVLDMSAVGAAVDLVQQQYVEVCSVLDGFGEAVYSDWRRTVGQICLLNLDQPLIRRDVPTGLLSVSFNQELLAVLRDVKLLQMLDRTSIPMVALEVYQQKDMFLTCVRSCQLLVQWYNGIRQRAVEVEVSLMKVELEAVDQQLRQAETELTWQHQNCWSYICQVKDTVYRLDRRLQKAKDNLQTIQELLRGWSRQLMFCRRDSKKDTLLTLDDRAARVAKTYSNIRRDGETIHSLLQENRRLFGAAGWSDGRSDGQSDGGSGGWRDYVEYVDEMVVESLFGAISRSLQFFVENMEESGRSAPLLEVQMELGGAQMVFRPSLDAHAGDGFYELVEGLLADIFKMSAQVRRVASHLDMQDYQDDMDDMLDLLDMRQEVMERVNDVIRRVSQYQRLFERYAPLWLDDRAEFLRLFLLYGQPPTAEYMELYGEDALPETPPTTEQFREQIDHYEALYVEVSELEDWRVFEGWFRLDIRPFKISLLNTIKKWSWMFKEHLISFVSDNMAELQDFILKADGELRKPVSGGDYQAVVKVMGCLLAVRDRQASTDQLFQPLQVVVSLLEQYGETLPDNIYTQLEELPERWSSIKKLAWTVKHEVAPLQNAEVALIRKKYEHFEVKLSQFEKKFRTEAPLQYNSENPYPRLDTCYSEVEVLEVERVELQECCKLFEVSSPDVRQLRVWRREMSTLKQLWDLLTFSQSSIAAWSRTPWRDTDVDQMNTELRRITKEMQTLDKDTRGWDVFVGLDHRLKDLLTSLRAVTELQNPAMRERHWMQLVAATGVVFTLTERTTLADLLALQLHLYEEEVLSTVAKAVKEMAIEKVLSEISQTWALMEFTYEGHFRTTTPLLKCDDELIEMLEEHQVQLQATLQMKQVEFFHAQVLVLQARLSRAECVLMLWLEVQRTWAHLESVFVGTDDIEHQLPADTMHFLSINSDFKDLMCKSAETKNVLEATNRPQLLETLTDLQMRLAVCEKALAKYLETKRMAFPRFYFLSSADLLDILSRGSQPKQVTPHLVKLFDSVADLHLTQEATEATGIFSGEGEYLPLGTYCHCVGPVEVWLSRVEEAMRAAVRRQIAEAVAAYEERPRELWALERPAQAALTAIQIWWTTDVELAFQRMAEGFDTALRDYSRKQTAQLTSLISVLKGELSPGDRRKIMTICTLDVHARDVVSRLVAQKVSSAQAFTWLSQLRNCWDEDQRHCFAKICDAQFLYSYEYLGNKPRLVITPLTDRCYVTLTQSLHLTMGGAPAGPAGTGKTETTKDLGRALGVMVYVFNCSQQMDYRSIGNIFKGLCQTGAWGCFDEFNRMAAEVLSVVAVQVKAVQDALRHRKTRFVFLDEEIGLKPGVGVFVTMNPGYSGRTELPENLKALFRPCAMVVPDMELICEIMLMAEGFLNAKLLGRKFITLYNLCKELLSLQDHYDWGLRAVKSVLVVAGGLRRGDTSSPEDQVLMRALRDFNLPKMVMEDVPVFLGLVSDLFPGVEAQRRTDPDFEELVRQSALELRLQPEDSFVLKVVQLEEQLSVRHSVFVVGGAGTGKSQILRTLHRTYASMRRKPVWNDLNPKALTTDQLFGFIHPATREWKDGLLSHFMREQARNPHAGPKWIILDGDVDPVWIESLNTVMDDNKVLTLASNERIPLTASMRLLFEVGHLRSATPATVSRAGVLYISPQDLNWNMFVNSWIDRRQRQAERAHLTILFDKYVSRCIERVRSSSRTITPIPENSMVQTLCSLLDGLLTPEDVPADSPRDVYEMYFVFACIWAFGGATYQDQLHDYRAEFSQWWVKEMKSVKLPAHATGTVFDFYLDPQTRRFVPWADRVPSFQLEADAPLQAVLVPTAETVRLQYFLRLLLDGGQPVMLVGETGTGKSALVRDLLNTEHHHFLFLTIHLHYYSSAHCLQRLLERPLEKKAGRSYSPPGGRRLVYFIDDINVTAADGYGAVQPHALIRQHLDYKHWFDTQTLCMKEIYNTQYIACMNPQSGHSTIDPRLQRHFSVLAMNSPNRETLNSIFSSILTQHLQSRTFSPDVVSSGPALAQAAVTLHHTVSCHFLPSAKNFLHVFSLWDLSRLFQGLLFSRPECMGRGSEMWQLWVHESRRVYSDRFSDSADQNLFRRLQADAARQAFEGLEEEPDLQEPVAYLHRVVGAEPAYTPVLGWEELSSTLSEALNRYNQLYSTMNLVLFQEAMLHVCRISRILACPQGHALLVGVGGSGKQSLTRLAAHFSDMDVFQPTVHRGYGLQELKVDVAELCVKAGVRNLPTVLLLTDTQIPDDHFLIIISTLISGEVPEVLSEEEVDGVMKAVKMEVRALGLLDTVENCWRFFTERVRQQLKVVLGVSPVGNTLRVRVQRFPALLSCTTVDWFHEWPQEALHSVSLHFLQELPALQPTVQEPISLFMAYAHASTQQAGERSRQSEHRHYYSSPRGFLELLHLYRVLLEERNQHLQEKLDRLHSGLQKLKTTAVQVEELKAKLNSQEEELSVKNRAAEALISRIGQQTERVSQKRMDADLEEQKVAAIQAEVTLRQQDCEKDLSKAEPALEAATTALNTLNKVNLTELKTFPNPPKAVMNVLAAVMVLLAPHGRIPKERGWKAARAFMGKVDDFLQALVSYDKEHIPDQCLNVVKTEYLSNPDFLPELVLTKSYAAAGLCAWTINIIRYYEVYCVVVPKRQALSQANAELESATAKLLSVRKKLDDLDGHLQDLTAQFERAAFEKLHCQEEVTSTSKTIQLANRLVGGLQSEKVRWSAAVVELEAQQVALCGDVLLAAAFVSYAGFFSQAFRQQLLETSWRPFLTQISPPIPLTEGLDPVLLLADLSSVAAWHTQGLPADRLSVENAAILTRSRRCPLLVDPQQQAGTWLRNLYGSGLRVVQHGQTGYSEVVEEALDCGEAVLIENLEEKLDPVLEPLLSRTTRNRGRSVRLGEQTVSVRLLLHTKLANPHFPPELQAQTTLINFTVTRAGLEEQLLGQVVTHERPDLESLKCELSMQQNVCQMELKELEDELLGRLSGAEGSFLRDATLVEQLEHTKTTSSHILRKVVEAKKNELKINSARELYRSVAKRAALLFFIIKELHIINPLYQHSLQSFSAVFLRAIEDAEEDADVAARVRSLTKSLTLSVLQHISRGMFQRDRLTFLTHTTFQVLLMEGSIEAEELDLLLHLPSESSSDCPVSFLSAQAWGTIRALSVLEAFRGLDRDVEGSAKRWRKLVESECPERECLPLDWKKKSSLQKLIILRAMRPDRMSNALRNFVKESLGSEYLDPGKVEFEKVFEESSSSSPIFFILSPGVNPLMEVEALGLKLGFSTERGNLHSVSLGQGQEDVAEKALEAAALKGHWVILQNVHLVEHWLGRLSDLLELLGQGADPQHRVFLTGQPGPSPDRHIIPRIILENSLKLTNEPPTGMSSSLHAALSTFSQDTLEMCTHEQEFKALLFTLCYFHACVSERRKFGAQGWNRRYPFNTGDLSISASVLYNCLEANSKVPWEDLCYLVGEIMYGGHITDEWDRRLCRTQLQELFNPKLIEGELFLCPGFPAPPNMDYVGYHRYVDDTLPTENPSLYGLHPNAEIEFMTATSDSLFRTLLELQPRDSALGEEAGLSVEEKVREELEELLEKLPEEYDLVELLTKTDRCSPYTLVCVQECERMNQLISEIHTSLTELDLTLKGELSSSPDMDALQEALFYSRVPGSWSRLAFPSTRTLGPWFSDVLAQCRELDTWTQDFVLPAVVWLSGFFNPQSFLTAIMQSIARKNKWPLDRTTLSVDVTKKTKDDYGHPPREGAYIHGLYMEGARWDCSTGVLAEAVLKDLTPAMPVLYVRAAPADRLELRNTYECPVYRTKLRGPTFIWSFHLKTRHPPAKWVLAGVALLLSV